MIDLDFLEIGSCDYDTLLDHCDINSAGIIIEPIDIYLKRLPDFPKVKKFNVAISPINEEGYVEIFYVPPEVIENNKNLHNTLKGCNAVGQLHQQHILWNLQDYVQTTKVKLCSLPQLLIENQIRKIEHLKIDIEGGDSLLLLNFSDYLKSKTLEFYPKKITFETNELTPCSLVDKVIDLYLEMGYKLEKRALDTILIL